MKSQILQTIEALFTDDSVQQMAWQTGETPSGIRKGLDFVVPAVLRGFAAKTAEGDSAAAELLRMAKDAHDDNWWVHVRQWFGDVNKEATGSDILKHIFGHSNVERLAQNIGHQSAIKTTSATSLLQWAAPLCLGIVGKHAAEQHLDAGALANALAKMNVDLTHAVTAKEQIAGQFRADNTAHKGSGNRLLWFVLLGLLLAAVAILCVRSCKPESAPVAAPSAKTDTVTPASVQQSREPIAKLDADSTIEYTFGDTVTEKLPDGTVLRIADNGAEALLLQHIHSALEKGLDTTEEGIKSSWINLYNVQFSKMLTYRNGAAIQIKNIAVILKAFRMVKIKIGGYSDATGAIEVNKKLSLERAQKVAADLGHAGVQNQISSVEGYGPEFPVGDNETAAGRAQNRRVSCRITSVTR